MPCDACVAPQHDLSFAERVCREGRDALRSVPAPDRVGAGKLRARVCVDEVRAQPDQKLRVVFHQNAGHLAQGDAMPAQGGGGFGLPKLMVVGQICGFD